MGEDGAEDGDGDEGCGAEVWEWLRHWVGVVVLVREGVGGSGEGFGGGKGKALWLWFCFVLFRFVVVFECVKFKSFWFGLVYYLWNNFST